MGHWIKIVDELSKPATALSSTKNSSINPSSSIPISCPKASSIKKFISTVTSNSELNDVKSNLYLDDQQRYHGHDDDDNNEAADCDDVENNEIEFECEEDLSIEYFTQRKSTTLVWNNFYYYQHRKNTSKLFFF